MSTASFDDAALAGVPLAVRVSASAKRMRLSIDPRTGSVLLTVPRRVSRRNALAWAAGHRAWIDAALADVPPALPLVPDAELPLYGRPHRIDWRPERSRTVRVCEGSIETGGPEELIEARLIRWLKGHARDLLDRETREFAAKADISVGRIGVGDPRSRWGSCSSSGSIRYSWRLIFAPDWVRRATVAHEVAHRVHMNHGRAFYELTERLLEADPRPAREWLRRNGASLHRIGSR